jgi:hypothetical protein
MEIREKHYGSKIKGEKGGGTGVWDGKRGRGRKEKNLRGTRKGNRTGRYGRGRKGEERENGERTLRHFVQGPPSS